MVRAVGLNRDKAKLSSNRSGRDAEHFTARRMVMGNFNRRVLLTALVVMTATAPAVSVADEKIEGKVMGTNLTLCHPKPTGGGCEGTLTLETKTGGTTQQVAIKVMADTIIKKGQDYLLLPQTQDNSVVVTYVTEKGQKVAKSIDVVGTAR